MGFAKRWDTNEILLKLSSMAVECNSPSNDGFTAFEIKKDLWQIKFLIDKIVSESPKFAGETDWLEEQEKLQVWAKLKK